MELQYKQIPENQGEIRNKMIKRLMDNPIGIAPTAKEIGMSHITLRKFVRDGADMDFRVLSKINNYLNNKESNK